ncbi:MAG: hypothetical protein DRJ14_04230 [Acidobacteria bacterium]|nr:MAG: hypothetical protein DRJ14_04230 [Acidobacteriota bacterium]
MKCKEIQDILSLYHQGLLDTDLAEQVARHLSHCESCKEALMQEKRISDGLNDLFGRDEMSSVPEDIAELVLEKSQRELPVKLHRRSPVKLIFRFGAVAATVLLTLWLSFLFRHSPAVEIDMVQDAPVRTVLFSDSPVRTPQIREVQRKATVTRLKENVIWISYKN